MHPSILAEIISNAIQKGPANLSNASNNYRCRRPLLPSSSSSLTDPRSARSPRSRIPITFPPHQQVFTCGLVRRSAERHQFRLICSRLRQCEQGLPVNDTFFPLLPGSKRRALLHELPKQSEKVSNRGNFVRLLC